MRSSREEKSADLYCRCLSASVFTFFFALKDFFSYNIHTVI